MSNTAYTEKLNRIADQTLLPRLEAEAQEFLREIATSYRFTFQELKKVAQAARDLEMWREESLAAWWRSAEHDVSGEGRPRKKALLASLDRRLASLESEETRYPEEGLAAPPRRSVRLQETESGADVFGRCPA